MTCKDCIHYNVSQDYDNRVALEYDFQVFRFWKKGISYS